MEENKVFQTIQKRKSCRSFSNKPVSKESLKKIIEAGQYAPSGGNSKTGKIIVITDKELQNQMEKIVENEFSKMTIESGMYKSIVSSIKQSKKGGYHFSYQPNVFVIVINKKDYVNAMADSVCIVENMMLEATELEIGSCYINQLHWLTDNEKVRDFLKPLGLEEDEHIYAGLSLGYPNEEKFFERSRKIKNNIVLYY